MWKWVAWGALFYGMLCMMALAAPQRPALQLGSTFDQFYRAVEQSVQGHPPPGLIDFEGAAVALPQSLPPSSVTIVETGGGNHALRWEPTPGPLGLSLLAIPVEPPDGAAQGLALQLRAEGLGNVALGVRERDGSLYVMVQHVTPGWQPTFIPFDQLRLSKQTSDENGRLDPDQIMAVVVTVRERKRERERRGPAFVELDDIEFQRLPPGLPPGPPGPPGLGPPPPDGRGGNGDGSRRERPAPPPGPPEPPAGPR